MILYVLSTRARKAVAIIEFNHDPQAFSERIKQVLLDHFGEEYETINIPRMKETEGMAPEYFSVTCDCFEPNDEEAFEEDVELTKTNLYKIQ